MIRNHSQIRVDSKDARQRFDLPRIRLPHPHFDATSSTNVLRFLSQADEILNDSNSSSDLIGTTIWQICGVLHTQRRTLLQQDWRAFIEKIRLHPLCKTLHNDAFTYRSFSKPRGYSGDAVLLDYIYGTEHFWSAPEMNGIGQRIFRWSTVSAACQGVKARRAIIADTINQVANSVHRPDVMSLAAGHLREAEFCSAIVRQKLKRLVAVDSDPKSVAIIGQEYGGYGVEPIHATAREIISGKVNAGKFDLIYSSGLCDYLSDSMCQRLALNLFEMLKPGGKLLLTNFVDNIESVGYMEAYMDWNLIYRDRIQMMSMTKRIPDRMLQSIQCFSEENFNVIFLVAERNHN